MAVHDTFIKKKFLATAFISHQKPHKPCILSHLRNTTDISHKKLGTLAAGFELRSSDPQVDTITFAAPT
jgi:hypothetical protein